MLIELLFCLSHKIEVDVISIITKTNSQISLRLDNHNEIANRGIQTRDG